MITWFYYTYIAMTKFTGNQGGKRKRKIGSHKQRWIPCTEEPCKGKLLSTVLEPSREGDTNLNGV